MAHSNEPRTTAAPGDAGQDGTAPGGKAHGDGTLGPVAHTGGDCPQPVEPPGALHIRLDRQDIEVSPDLLHNGTATGRQIREWATPPIGPDRDLFEIVPGGSDRKIEDGDTVEIRDHLRFFSAPRNINPGAARGLALSVSSRGHSPYRRSVRRAAQ